MNELINVNFLGKWNGKWSNFWLGIGRWVLFYLCFALLMARAWYTTDTVILLGASFTAGYLLLLLLLLLLLFASVPLIATWLPGLRLRIRPSSALFRPTNFFVLSSFCLFVFLSFSTFYFGLFRPGPGSLCPFESTSINLFCVCYSSTSNWLLWYIFLRLIAIVFLIHIYLFNSKKLVLCLALIDIELVSLIHILGIIVIIFLINVN